MNSGLNPAQRELMLKMGKIKFAKFMTRIMKLYNQLCTHCKRKVQTTPGMQVSDYCPACQHKAQELLGPFLKK